MNAMSLLLIDTSLRQGWVGVSRGESVIATRSLDSRRGHARDLSSSITAVLNDADIKLPALTAIATNVGPGSFTGIRVALATSKAISYAAGTRLIAIDTFDLVARGFAHVAVDFRVVFGFQLNGWLVCDYASQGDGSHRRGAVRVVAGEDSHELRTAGPLCGPGVEKLKLQLNDVKTLHGDPWVPCRDAFLAIASERVRSDNYADPFAIEPVYATMSSAEQLWLNRPAASSG